MKSLYTFILIFFISISTSACSLNNSLQDAVSKTIDGVVVVYSTRSSNKKADGLGTGFFIDENLILTNHHVVNNSAFIHIKNSKSNKKYKATIVAQDELSDIAIISIPKWDLYKKTEKWKILKFLPTNNLKIGQKIWTFGHPWGLEYSVSRGIISALDRRIDRSPQYFIQVDAKVFSGNSGGPLLDYNGNVIGVNSRMVAQKGGSYGFSLTGNFVQKVVRQLKKFNKTYWIKLGIKLKIKNNGSLYIDGVLPNSVASVNGLEKGDELIRIISIHSPEEGRRIISLSDLLISISMLEKNEIFFIEIIRDGLTKIIPVVAQNI